MRVGLMVNDVRTEEAQYTTIRLAVQLINTGHEAWLMGAGDFVYDTDEKVHAIARTGPRSSYGSETSFLRDVHGPKARVERITVDDLDVLMLRSDPSTEHGDRAWAQTAGILFGRVAMRDRPERSQRPSQGYEQDVFSAVSRVGSPANADQPGQGRDQEIHQGGGRPGRPEAASGIGRGWRIPRPALQRIEPEPDD